MFNPSAGWLVETAALAALGYVVGRWVLPPGWLKTRWRSLWSSPREINGVVIAGIEAHLLTAGDYVVFQFDAAMPRDEIERRAQVIAGAMPEGVRMIFAAGVERITTFRPVGGAPAPKGGA